MGSRNIFSRMEPPAARRAGPGQPAVEPQSAPSAWFAPPPQPVYPRRQRSRPRPVTVPVVDMVGGPRLTTAGGGGISTKRGRSRTEPPQASQVVVPGVDPVGGPGAPAVTPVGGVGSRTRPPSSPVGPPTIQPPAPSLAGDWNNNGRLDFADVVGTFNEQGLAPATTLFNNLGGPGLAKAQTVGRDPVRDEIAVLQRRRVEAFLSGDRR